MWFGRLTFLITGKDINKDALVSGKESHIQTLAASMITSAMHNEKISEKSALEVWKNIYLITAFFVGLSDDLTLMEYQKATKAVLGDKDVEDLCSRTNFNRLRAQIAFLRSPEIYGGTGDIQLESLPHEGEPEELTKLLETTKGMRFMGQRFIPDSYMFQNVVYPTVKDRFFPDPLDVMTILGSKTAEKYMREKIKKNFRDYVYPTYDRQINKLKKEFSQMQKSDWHQNLYWNWLYVLKSLLKDKKDFKNYPSFMQTDAYIWKLINSACGSWAQLRHDTILYAKQSYTPRAGGRPPRPKEPAPGLVEPLPEFYARLLALTKMTRKGLKSLDALDRTLDYRYGNLEKMLMNLVKISEKELSGELLTKQDQNYIKTFARTLQYAVGSIEKRMLKSTIIADVHTDLNTRKCVEVGTGNFRTIVAVFMYKGNLNYAVGPVFSYYNFKHPIKDRLTDEKWRSMIASNSQPALPTWTKIFATNK